MSINKNKTLSKIRKIAKLIQRDKPGLTEERNSRHKPLDLLILLILNQSTSDVLSDQAFLELKRVYPSYEKLLKENRPGKLAKTIQICGLAPTKALYILNALTFLRENYSLDPHMAYIHDLTDIEAIKLITSIKGVGIKSASCLLMFAFKRDTFAIDTHIFRILHRLGDLLSPKVSTERAHRILQPLIPPDLTFILHVGLVEHGRAICHARKPLCEECVLAQECSFYRTAILAKSQERRAL